MDWILIFTIILAVVAIITLYVIIGQSRKKKPTWAFNTRQVIGRDAESPPELRFIFGDRQVEEVYVTTVIFFNRGNENYYGDLVPTDKSDINEPVIIDFGGAQILREPAIKRKSKGVANKFGAEKIPDGNGQGESVKMHFPILAHNDGALIEVWCLLQNEIGRSCKQNSPLLQRKFPTIANKLLKAPDPNNISL